MKSGRLPFSWWAACGCREKFAWREKLPLFGCRVVVTRPRERGGAWRQAAELGAEVLEAPAIATVPLEPDAAWDAAMEAAGPRRLAGVHQQTGVELFLERLRSQNRDIRMFHRAEIAAIGTGTEAELRKYGLIPRLVPAVLTGPIWAERWRLVFSRGMRFDSPGPAWVAGTAAGAETGARRDAPGAAFVRHGI